MQRRLEHHKKCKLFLSCTILLLCVGVECAPFAPPSLFLEHVFHSRMRRVWQYSKVVLSFLGFDSSSSLYLLWCESLLLFLVSTPPILRKQNNSHISTRILPAFCVSILSTPPPPFGDILNVVATHGRKHMGCAHIQTMCHISGHRRSAQPNTGLQFRLP